MEHTIGFLRVEDKLISFTPSKVEGKIQVTINSVNDLVNGQEVKDDKYVIGSTHNCDYFYTGVEAALRAIESKNGIERLKVDDHDYVIDHENDTVECWKHGIKQKIVFFYHEYVIREHEYLYFFPSSWDDKMVVTQATKQYHYKRNLCDILELVDIGETCSGGSYSLNKIPSIGDHFNWGKYKEEHRDEWNKLFRL